jgi:hypothetical protein
MAHFLVRADLVEYLYCQRLSLKSHTDDSQQGVFEPQSEQFLLNRALDGNDSCRNPPRSDIAGCSRAGRSAGRLGRFAHRKAITAMHADVGP